jgi:hypothetical protein
MSIVLGLDAKLYRNTGTHGSPVFNEIPNTKDVTLALEKNTADVTTRGNNGWRAMVGVLKDGSVDFQMIWDTGDLDFGAVRDAFLNNTTIEFAIMSGVITATTSEGLLATFAVIKFTRNEPLEEALTVDVSIKPTYAPTTPPQWIVGSGAYT